MFGPNLQELETRVANLERELSYRERWRGTYTPGMVYAPQDVVLYNGVTYLSLKQNFNSVPDSSPTNWLPQGPALPNAPIDYAFNGDFQHDTGSAGVIVLGTSYTPFIPGWGAAKGAAGDTCTAQILGPGGFGVDPLSPAGYAVILQRTYGTGGNIRLEQFPVVRVVGGMWSKTITITARVWCSQLGTTRIRYWNGSAYVNGAVNVTVGAWETIWLTVTTSDYAWNAATGFGVEMVAGTFNTTTYVSRISVLEGRSPFVQVPFRSPTNAGSISAGAQAARAPICTIAANAPGTTVANAWTQLPFPTVAPDTDNMGGVANRITIRTPGRYWVYGSQLFYSGTNTSIHTNIYLNGGTQLPRFAASTGFDYGTSQHTPGLSANNNYTSCQVAAIEDFLAGDYLTMHYYSYVAGVGIHTTGILCAVWVGD